VTESTGTFEGLLDVGSYKEMSFLAANALEREAASSYDVALAGTSLKHREVDHTDLFPDLSHGFLMEEQVVEAQYNDSSYLEAMYYYQQQQQEYQQQQEQYQTYYA
jgi:hypothetical protein